MDAFRGSAILLLLIPSMLWGDVLPPGHRSISHYIKFSNLEKHPGYVFYSGYWTPDLPADHPRRQRHSGPVDRVGEEVHISGNPILGNRRLFAVPQEIAPPEGPLSLEWLEANSSKVLNAELPWGTRTVPVSDQRERIVTRMEVEISNNQLKIHQLPDPESPTGEENSDRTRWYIAGGFVLAGVMVLLGWVVFLRRKA